MEDNILIDEKIVELMMPLSHSPQAIYDELHKKGFALESIEAYQKEIKRLRNKKRQFNGLICIGIGAFLGFISCVLTITNAFPELYGFLFYGLTTIGVLIAFLGLYFLFD